MTTFTANGKILWSMICIVVCWSIWLKRNKHDFLNRSEPSYNIFNLAEDLILVWFKQFKDIKVTNRSELPRD